MTRLILTVSACALVLAGPVPALAQHQAPTAAVRTAVATVTADQRTAAVAAIIRAVETRYVFPERVPAIRDRLNEGLASGRYDVSDPAVFAERLSDDLRESGQDGHMYLLHEPAQYAAAVTSDADPYDNPAFMAIWAAAARRSNHGLSEMRILPGNVRYLRVSTFHWVQDRTGEAYDDAVRFLREGDAVIIDLRGNGGGDHAAVRYLLSHFMEPDELDMTFLEAGKEPVQSRTLDHVPAGRLTGKPLYVLISRQVGSAAEAFAYSVQKFHLGTLVGGRTGGAANNNTFVPIAPGFMLSVSYGRPVHPVTGSNWEGTGVEPDVAVDPTTALETATALALETLLARTDADPVDRAGWEWAWVAAAARVRPVTIASERLQALAGTYGGRAIVFENGGLVWRRANGPAARLLPLTGDGLFALENGDDRVRLRLTGDALELLRMDDPAPSRFPRD